MSTSIKHIFLDVDGVLADFTTAALQVHGRLDAISSWPIGERDVPKVLGISRTQYWKLIDEQGADFWENLEPYPWFEELISLVRCYAPLTLLTASTLSPHCSSGKVAWISKQFPKTNGRTFTDFLIGRQKHLLAGDRRVLIDDAELMVDDFTKSGGHGTLFPRKWNRNHAIEDPIGHVADCLKAIADGWSPKDIR